MKRLYLCRMCGGRLTNSILTMRGNFEGPCLPVCIVCVPPWVNSNTDDWWYELLVTPGNQRQPTEAEVQEMLRERKEMTVFPTQQRKAWRTDDLLSQWDGTQYTFTRS